MKAFTYLIKEKKTEKWYYGVRYAVNCCISDMFTVYFTSGVLYDCIKTNPDNFTFEIRKTFNCVETAVNWEYKVLRRMKIKERTDCYNKHVGKAPPRMFGDENPSRRADVREKLRMSSTNRPKPSEDIKQKISWTKCKKNIFNYFRDKKYKEEPVKSELHKLNKWIFLLENIGKHKRIINTLKNRIYLIFLIEKKPYPKGRKRGKRGKMPSISNAKLGTKWYTNQHTGEIRAFRSNDEIPIGFIPGMKNRKKPKLMTEDHKKKLSVAMSNFRRKQKNEKLCYDESNT
jgi:hypothetical protein